jgi:hypothetical protein
MHRKHNERSEMSDGGAVTAVRAGKDRRGAGVGRVGRALTLSHDLLRFRLFIRVTVL